TPTSSTSCAASSAVTARPIRWTAGASPAGTGRRRSPMGRTAPAAPGGGGDTRAGDVQTLFADAATGSRSTAMVSQGRVGTLINAKPADRRMIIDEAAGITGPYARRHRAELRLRAAEANLARVQDVLVALEEQHKGLKRQARQASRYRNLSDPIRRAEAPGLARH